MRARHIAARLIRSFHPRRIPVTYAFLLLLLGSYAGQLIITGNWSYSAAYAAVPKPPSIEYVLVNPWLHSDHFHILGNAVMLLFLGWWTERRVEQPVFLAIVLSAGYLSNLLPAILGFGGLGLGASGVTNMLWGFFTGEQLLRVQRSITEHQLTSRAVLAPITLYLFGLVFVLKAIAEFFGYLPSQAGTATGAHFLGVLLGLIWVLVRVRRSNPKKGPKESVGA